MGAGVALILKGAPDEKVDLISSGRRRACDAGARGRSQAQGTAAAGTAAESVGRRLWRRSSRATTSSAASRQSNHKPSVNAYFEPRYNITPYLQLYAGVAGSSISFPNRAAAEIDGTVGIRPTFGPLALDFGGIVYWYPGGSCFNGSVNPVFGVDCLENGFLPVNGNVIKKDLTFWEAYARGTYTVNDSGRVLRPGRLLALGAQFGRQGHLRGRQCEVHRSERRDA